ncbi:MAG: DHA2 family efflux MFS transporter permease subunit [Alphaproteobacteria bacterium]
MSAELERASTLSEPEAPVGLAKVRQIATGILATMLYVIAVGGAGMALPKMQGAFSAAPDQIAWIVIAFIVASSMTNACAGWLSDRLGRRRLFLTCIAGFTVSTAACGFAQSLEAAVLARVLQGAFGAPLSPLGQSIAIDAWPRRRQTLGTSIWSMGALWSSLISPLAGGYLAEYQGWPWVFLMSVPLGVLTFAVGWFGIPPGSGRARVYLDWVGFLTLIASIGAFMYGLSRGERLDWFASGQIIGAAVIAVLAFYAFVVHVSTTPRPFVPLELFSDRNYTLALVFMFVYALYNYLPLFVLPIVLTGVMNLTLPVIGMLLATRPFGTFTGMLLIAPVADRIDTRILLLVGFTALMVPMWMMARWGIDPSWTGIVFAMFLQGFGSGIPYVGISAMAFSTLPTHLRSQGMSLMHLINNLGVAIGTTAVFSLLTREMQMSRSALSEFANPFNEALQQGTGHLHLGQTGDLAAFSVEIGRQAMMIAFNSTSQIAAYAGLVVLPLLLIARVRR